MRCFTFTHYPGIQWALPIWKVKSFSSGKFSLFTWSISSFPFHLISPFLLTAISRQSSPPPPNLLPHEEFIRVFHSPFCLEVIYHPSQKQTPHATKKFSFCHIVILILFSHNPWWFHYPRRWYLQSLASQSLVLSRDPVISLQVYLSHSLLSSHTRTCNYQSQTPPKSQYLAYPQPLPFINTHPLSIFRSLCLAHNPLGTTFLSFSLSSTPSGVFFFPS